MKCPKCGYLGFETGDRCKHCGYDFSLLSAAASEPDYDLRITLDDDRSIHPIDEIDDRDPWLGGRDEASRNVRETIDEGLTQAISSRYFDEPVIQLDRHVDEEPTRGSSPPRPAPPLEGRPRFPQPASPKAALPLFAPPAPDDDQPLIKLPTAPRPPLQVRRTPDTPSLRAFTNPVSRPASGPGLQFSEEPVGGRVDSRPPQACPPEPTPGVALNDDVTRPGARVMAAAIDLAILLGVDFGVVYFTVRMAGLTMGEWNHLPLAPLLTFLMLLKISYFYAFTAIGGQTIGKMAAGTCVVADDGGDVDAAQALRRTCAGVLSVLLLGLGLVPALFGDRRALHDRLARTRVVSLRSA